MKAYKNYMDRIKVDPKQHERFLKAMEEAQREVQTEASERASEAAPIRIFDPAARRGRILKRAVMTTAAVLAVALLSVMIYPRISRSMDRAGSEPMYAGGPDHNPQVTSQTPATQASFTDGLPANEPASPLPENKGQEKTASDTSPTPSSDIQSRSSAEARPAKSPTGAGAPSDTGNETELSYPEEGSPKEENAELVNKWIEAGLLIPVPDGALETVSGEEAKTGPRIRLNGTVYIPDPEKEPAEIAPVLEWIESQKN